MKRVFFLLFYTFVACSSYAQWTQGCLKNAFGDTTTIKYLEYIVRTGSFSKAGNTVVAKSPLTVRVRICQSQNHPDMPYLFCVKLYEKGSTKAINRSSVYKSAINYAAKLHDGRILTGTMIATEQDLRTPLVKSDSLLLFALQKEVYPILCTIKIVHQHTIAKYQFTLNPNGFTAAFKPYLQVTLPSTIPLNTTKKDTSMNDLGTRIVVFGPGPVYGVEQMPQYPGGNDALMKFIQDNLSYPNRAAEVGIEGRVTIRFVIDSNGNVTDVTVLRGLDPACDQAAVRVVKKMPKWTPGRQNGRKVPVYYTLPVVFKLHK